MATAEDRFNVYTVPVYAAVTSVSSLNRRLICVGKQWIKTSPANIINVKLSHIPWKYNGRLEVQLHDFLTSALGDTDDQLHARASVFRGIPCWSPSRSLRGPQKQSRLFEEGNELLPLPGVEPLLAGESRTTCRDIISGKRNIKHAK